MAITSIPHLSPQHFVLHELEYVASTTDAMAHNCLNMSGKKGLAKNSDNNYPPLIPKILGKNFS